MALLIATCAAVLVTAVAAPFRGGAAAQMLEGPTEHQVKAAFLYHFARFVEWPRPAGADSTAPFVFGVLGQDPFGRDLDEVVRGKTIQGRPVTVRRCSGAAEADSMQLLFVSASEAPRLPGILKRLAQRPVLTVGETPDFARAGGIIGFYVQKDRVRFEINLEAARRAGLHLSSKLLTLARIVSDRSER
jgi:hypothetical protein